MSSILHGQGNNLYEFACRLVIPDTTVFVFADGSRLTQGGFTNWGGDCWYTKRGGHHFVVTNDHVVHSRPGSENQIFFAVFNRPGSRPIPLILRAFQPGMDVAIFEVEPSYTRELPRPAVLSSQALLVSGQQVLMIPASRGIFVEPFDLVRGWVVNTEFVFDNAFRQPFLKIQIPTIGGNSGSPVVDSFGRVVGMHARRMIERFSVRNAFGDSLPIVPIDVPYGFGLAIPSDDIAILLDRASGTSGITHERFSLGGLGVMVVFNRYENGDYVRFPVTIVRINDPEVALAGVRPGDVLKAVNDVLIENGVDFVRELFMRRVPGERVELLLVRRHPPEDFSEIRINVVLRDGSSLFESRNQ